MLKESVDDACWRLDIVCDGSSSVAVEGAAKKEWLLPCYPLILLQSPRYGKDILLR